MTQQRDPGELCQSRCRTCWSARHLLLCSPLRLLCGPQDEEATLYASHTIWESRQTFDDWTESESFKKAHAQARSPNGTYLAPPRFEGFDVLL